MYMLSYISDFEESCGVCQEPKRWESVSIWWWLVHVYLDLLSPVSLCMLPRLAVLIKEWLVLYYMGQTKKKVKQKGLCNLTSYQYALTNCTRQGKIPERNSTNAKVSMLPKWSDKRIHQWTKTTTIKKTPKTIQASCVLPLNLVSSHANNDGRHLPLRPNWSKLHMDHTYITTIRSV